MKLRCNKCSQVVSTEVPEGTIVRAWVECSECVEKTPDLSQYKQQLVEKIRLKGNRITKSPLYNQALKDCIKIIEGGL